MVREMTSAKKKGTQETIQYVCREVLWRVTDYLCGLSHSISPFSFFFAFVAHRKIQCKKIIIITIITIIIIIIYKSRSFDGIRTSAKVLIGRTWLPFDFYYYDIIYTRVMLDDSFAWWCLLGTKKSMPSLVF